MIQTQSTGQEITLKRQNVFSVLKKHLTATTTAHKIISIIIIPHAPNKILIETIIFRKNLLWMVSTIPSFPRIKWGIQIRYDDSWMRIAANQNTGFPSLVKKLSLCVKRALFIHLLSPTTS